MPVTGSKIGVADTAPGSGVQEILALLSGSLGGLVQPVASIPMGDTWQMKASTSHTPTLITDTLPPHPLMAYKVPSTKSLLFTGGVYHCLLAATDYVRVCRRYFMYGYQATVAPAASAAPTTLTLTPATSGIGTSGVYSYKIAAIDSFRREGPLSVATGTATLTSTNQAINVSGLPALPTGAIAFNIYRTLAGGSSYFYIGTKESGGFIDGTPDAQVGPAPAVTWVTGEIAGETADGPCELIAEVGAVVPTSPTGFITPYYLDGVGQLTRRPPQTSLSTIGQRSRLKLLNETQNFVAAPTLAANLWRGPYTTDIRERNDEDSGTTKVRGIEGALTAGCITIWGQQVIGSTERNEATAAIKAMRIEPVFPQGVLLPPNAEIVVEIGALAAGVAAVRDVSLSGLLLPATAT